MLRTLCFSFCEACRTVVDVLSSGSGSNYADMATLPFPILFLLSPLLLPFPSPFQPPSPLSPFTLPLLSSPSLHSFLSLRSRSPSFQLGGLGSDVSCASGVWDEAPAEIDFGAF